MKFVIPIMLFLLFLACSDDKPILTLNEKNYLKTQDSLVKYKSFIAKLSDGNTLQKNVSDYINLDYKVYKNKYHFSEKQMDSTRRALNTCCKIVKTFIEIEENMSRSNLIKYHSVNPNDSIKGSYSFDQKLKPAKLNKDKNVEVKVLMDAFEEKKKNSK